MKFKTAFDLIEDAFKRRWRNIIESSNKHGVPAPDKTKVWEKFLDKFNHDFRCAYCGEKLAVRDSYPYLRVFSIDHKKSLFTGGDNSIDNLEIVCHRCNVVKGTMGPDTFTELLRLCPKDLVDKMFEEIWAGRIRNKLDREDAVH